MCCDYIGIKYDKTHFNRLVIDEEVIIILKFINDYIFKHGISEIISRFIY